jgi:hypothetical protein
LLFLHLAFTSVPWVSHLKTRNKWLCSCGYHQHRSGVPIFP